MVSVQIFSDSRYPVNRKIVRKAVEESLIRNKLGEGDIEVSVAVVGRRKMKQLTDKYVEDGLEHEILSFPFEDIQSPNKKGFINAPDNILRLGDIILCWPDVVLAAGREDVMVDDEVYFLTSHGVDHLLGKHHEDR